MANADLAMYNYLLTNTPLVLNEQKEEFSKTCQKTAPDMKKAIETVATTLASWKDFENQEDSLKLHELLEKAKNELFELHALRVECTSDIDLLSTAIRTNKLPPTGTDYSTFHSQLKSEDNNPIDYKQEALKERKVMLHMDDLTKCLANARKALEDEDIMGIGDTQTTDLRKKYQCKISLSMMVEPLRNINCTHRYSKVGIMGLLKNKEQIGCPIQACGKPVKLESLIPDDDFAREVEEYLLNERSRRHNNETRLIGGKNNSSSSSTTIDED